MKVLIAEDEAKIAEFVVKGLNSQGFNTDHFEDGRDALEAARHTTYDAIVLDIMMPGMDGLAVLKAIRSENNFTPVILLTARAGLEDRLTGLNAGADDYLPKPFFVDELVARLHAITRRTTGETLTRRSAGPLTLDITARTVLIGGKTVELTAREFNLLEYLMRQPGRVFTRVQILEHVWNYDFDPNTNIVDVYIRRIRKKLSEHDSQAAEWIESVRGVGYKLRGS